MWLLELLDATGAVETALPAVEGVYTLGRKNASMCFDEDRSISRRHAEIRVGPVPGGDPRQQPLWVKDVGSKFKTIVNNGHAIEANKEILLKDGDVVRVGSQRSLRIKYQSLRLCGTKLSREAGSDLKALAKKVGASIAKKWDAQCTHLISPSAASIVTEKLVLALAERRPAIHAGWLKRLAEGASARPLRLVPDTAPFAAIVTRGARTMVVRESEARRSHLAGHFFVMIHKDEAFERIAEGTQGAVCRAYAMTDDDFVGQRWEELGAGRKMYHVQPLPAEIPTGEVARVLAVRSHRLTALGIEATTKTQLAEAVVYIRPMLSLRDAQAAGAGEGAMMEASASEAWGPSQSVASQQVSQVATSRVTGYATTPASGGSSPTPTTTATTTTTNKSSTRSANADSQRHTKHMPPPRPSAAPVATEATTTPAKPNDAREQLQPPFDPPQPAATPTPTTNQDHNAIQAEQPAGPTAQQEPVNNGVARDGIGRRAMSASGSRLNSREDGVGNERGVAGKEGGVANEERGVVSKGGGAAEGVGKRGRRRQEEDEGGVEAVEAGDNKPPEKRRRDGVLEAGDKVLPEGLDGEVQEIDGNDPGQEQEVAVAKDTNNDNDDGAPEKASSLRKRGRSAPVSSPPASSRTQPPVAARNNKSTNSTASRSSQQKLGGDQGDVSRVSPALGGGWMMAHNAVSANGRGGRAKKGGGVEEAKGVEDDQEEVLEDEEEQTPMEAAITEKCRLVARAYSTAAERSAATARLHRHSGESASRGGAAVPNFKRFRKNSILYGGEGLGEYFPKSSLRSTLPKESERELVLAAEQQQLEEEEADAERLFSQDIRGGPRAPRGRTKRR